MNNIEMFNSAAPKFNNAGLFVSQKKLRPIADRMRSHSNLDHSTSSIYEVMDRTTDVNLPTPAHAQMPSYDDSIFVYQSMDTIPLNQRSTLREPSHDTTLKSPQESEIKAPTLAHNRSIFGVSGKTSIVSVKSGDIS